MIEVSQQLDITQVIILALIQGLTEFLPISSSAHLILPSQLLGWPDQGLAFDVAVHVGTLCAVVLYFIVDLWKMLLGWLKSFTGQHSAHSQLAWAVILATLPAGAVGYLLSDWIETWLRSAIVIAIATCVFGLLLGWSDRVRGRRTLMQLNIVHALFIGVVQILALIPGTSRSGITMTAALMLGFDRQAAARFSFLLSIPLIAAAGGLKGVELYQVGTSTEWALIGTGFATSFVAALVCIHLFLRILDKIGMWPFVVYRLILGTALLALFWN